MKITIGFTRTDRPNDYIPGMDGYRKGAAQDVVVLDLDVQSGQPEGGWQAVEVAEAYFTATNAPVEVIDRDPLATAVRYAVMELVHEEGQPHRLTLDVGDTVQVDNSPVLAVASFGFEEIK